MGAFYFEAGWAASIYFLHSPIALVDSVLAIGAGTLNRLPVDFPTVAKLVNTKWPTCRFRSTVASTRTEQIRGLLQVRAVNCSLSHNTYYLVISIMFWLGLVRV